jgi:hypothetical protein
MNVLMPSTPPIHLHGIDRDKFTFNKTPSVVRACIYECPILSDQQINAVILNIEVFRDVTQCLCMNNYRRFEGS